MLNIFKLLQSIHACVIYRWLHRMHRMHRHLGFPGRFVRDYR